MKYLIILIGLVFAVGCSSNKSIITVNQKLSISKYNKIAVIAENDYSKKYSYQRSRSIFDLPSETKATYSFKIISDPKLENPNLYSFISLIESEFMKMGFNVINRDLIYKIMEEQQFSLSGLTADNTTKIGKLLGVNALVFIRYEGERNQVSSSQLRMIDVETASTLVNANYSGPIDRHDASLIDIPFSTARRNEEIANEFGSEIRKQLSK